MGYYRCTFFAKSVNMDQEFNMILPDDVKPGEKLKTLFLLHGYTGNHHQWMRFTSVERYSWTKRMAIVMPEAQNGFYINQVYGHPYFTVLSDLMEHVRTIFPLSDQREDTFVAGLSMGGYGALKWALTFPHLFSKTASLSGALDVIRLKNNLIEENSKPYAQALFGDTDLITSENNLFHLLENCITNQVEIPEIFVGCGTEDYLYDDSTLMKNFLETHKIKHHYQESSGAHDWSFWDEYIRYVIAWL
jgi:putative tributyrin esterase